MEEYWDLYDGHRNKTGEKHLRGQPLPKQRYHVVVHVWIINNKTQVLFTKRNPNKPYGNLWEGVGGSALAGENSLAAALRETQEEIGLSLHKEDALLLKALKRESDFVDIYLFHGDFPLSTLFFTDEEVVDALWANEQTYRLMCSQNIMVPTMTYFFDLFNQYKSP